jgi:hypothetical protein
VDPRGRGNRLGSEQTDDKEECLEDVVHEDDGAAAHDQGVFLPPLHSVGDDQGGRPAGVQPAQVLLAVEEGDVPLPGVLQGEGILDKDRPVPVDPAVNPAGELCNCVGHCDAPFLP